MKVFTGKVISKKMLKTAIVAVERVVANPLYGKRVKRIKKYHVHDETDSKVGDTVIFAPSRPYSRLKKWKVIRVVDDRKDRSEENRRVGLKKRED